MFSTIVYGIAKIQVYRTPQSPGAEEDSRSNNNCFAGKQRYVFEHFEKNMICKNCIPLLEVHPVQNAAGDGSLAAVETLSPGDLGLAGDFESQRPDLHVREDAVGALHRCHRRIGADAHAEKVALTLH